MHTDCCRLLYFHNWWRCSKGVLPASSQFFLRVLIGYSGILGLTNRGSRFQVVVVADGKLTGELHRGSIDVYVFYLDLGSFSRHLST